MLGFKDSFLLTNDGIFLYNTCIGKMFSNVLCLNHFFKFLIDLKAPTITDLPGSVAVNEPKKLNMVRCRASGYPVPKITWIRNGTKLPVCVKTGAVDSCAGENYQVFEHEDEDRAFRDSYLTIVSTKYPRDHGKYTCLAKNTQTAQKDVEVSIQGM